MDEVPTRGLHQNDDHDGLGYLNLEQLANRACSCLSPYCLLAGRSYVRADCNAESCLSGRLDRLACVEDRGKEAKRRVSCDRDSAAGIMCATQVRGTYAAVQHLRSTSVSGVAMSKVSNRRWALVGLILCTATAAQPGPDDSTLVRIDSGALRGVATDKVISFKGIPFAAPPIGNLRWRVPQPVKPWQGIRPADKFGPACMQTDNVPKSEDCLTLNVWRPTNVPQPLPVMVWIYGGAMVHGSTPMYPLDAIAAKGVVAVSMNYRLGRLGFFAHPALAAESPGRCARKLWLRGSVGGAAMGQAQHCCLWRQIRTR